MKLSQLPVQDGCGMQVDRMSNPRMGGGRIHDDPMHRAGVVAP